MVVKSVGVGNSKCLDYPRLIWELCLHNFITCLFQLLVYPVYALQHCRNGKNTVDFTYVDNVVHGHILAEQNLGPQGVANGQVRSYSYIKHLFILNLFST